MRRLEQYFFSLLSAAVQEEDRDKSEMGWAG
jgi:hypothetical protein